MGKEKRDTQRKLRDDLNDELKKWRDYQKAVRDAKHKEYLEYKAQKQAEYEAAKKAFEEEEAKRDPWEEEKLICEQLIEFCGKYTAAKDISDAKPEVTVDPLAFKKPDLDDDDMGFVSKVNTK